jgi:hypothetical protein
MSDFTLQGDTVTAPSSLIDLLDNSDTGVLRFNIGSAGSVNMPIYLNSNIGAAGKPIYVQNMNLSWTGRPTGRTGYGVYMYNGLYNMTFNNVVINNRTYGLYLAYAASNLLIQDSNLSNNGVVFAGSVNGYSINGLGLIGNNITNSDTGLALYNVNNSDGSSFDASTIYNNNIYGNGQNIYVNGSNSFIMGGNYWGHTTTPCFYTVESGLTPADANRIGIDDPVCLTSSTK